MLCTVLFCIGFGNSFFLWTNETWTWHDVGSPFGFTTCGWFLGPPDDRALFDTMLPKDVALSCINRQVGFALYESFYRCMVIGYLRKRGGAAPVFRYNTQIL